MPLICCSTREPPVTVGDWPAVTESHLSQIQVEGIPAAFRQVCVVVRVTAFSHVCGWESNVLYASRVMMWTCATTEYRV